MQIPELDQLARVLDAAGGRLNVRIVGEVQGRTGERLPLYVATMGNPDPELPAVGFFGGVHGLERIGTEVVIAYLRHLVMRLNWDASLHRLLETLRLVFMPLVNPVGMLEGTRANGNGVDLMRNAPVEARERVPFLVGGQRISARLPWYRGNPQVGMEIESRALCEVVSTELLPRQFSLALDCHSGFGWVDRIWFPYAHTREPMCHLAEIHALKEILQQTHPNHPYVFEPQSHQYLAHGDLWDYLHLGASQRSAHVFLPLTLEMGAWLWIKKNPRQLFSRAGIFNPQIAHRLQRVLRRHLALLDFLARACSSHHMWVPGEQARIDHHTRAMAHWYRH